VNQVREQIPDNLRRFDDPWGITWRLKNAIQRISLRKFWRFQTARLKAPRHQRPIFLLGAPRSGTSMIFRLLSAHPELGSLGREGHDMWRKFHHPRRNGWSSDVLASGQIVAGEREFIRRYLYMHFDQARFVEKTPENCLRLAYLQELYPDASYVFVRRDPREVMSSMLNGWRHPLGRFRSYFVPEKLEIPGYSHPHQWCFALIENWRDFKSQPLPRIVAEQWKQTIHGALAGRQRIGPKQWIELSLHEFTTDPREEMNVLLAKLGLSTDDKLLDLANENTVVNAMVESTPGNWQLNASELIGIFPSVKDEIEACGYSYESMLEETRAVADAVASGRQ
jgi:hypothetical protein